MRKLLPHALPAILSQPASSCSGKGGFHPASFHLSFFDESCHSIGTSMKSRPQRPWWCRIPLILFLQRENPARAAERRPLTGGPATPFPLALLDSTESSLAATIEPRVTTTVGAPLPNLVETLALPVFCFPRPLNSFDSELGHQFARVTTVRTV